MTEGDLRKLMMGAFSKMPPPQKYISVGPAAWRVFRNVMRESIIKILVKPRPANKSFADWRMALRRKLNGDTR